MAQRSCRPTVFILEQQQGSRQTTAKHVSTGVPAPAIPPHHHRLDDVDAQELATSDADGRSSAITDQIPQRPVGVVEGTSYSVMILAALGVRTAYISLCGCHNTPTTACWRCAVGGGQRAAPRTQGVQVFQPCP